MIAPLWQPGSQRIESSNLQHFIHHINDTHALTLSDYSDLYNWSIDKTEDFWSALWDFAGVIADKKSATVLENPEKMPGARWFPDSKLNFAENLLKFRDDRNAIVFRGEKGQRKALTY